MIAVSGTPGFAVRRGGIGVVEKRPMGLFRERVLKGPEIRKPLLR
jgi:hypothetical protein